MNHIIIRLVNKLKKAKENNKPVIIISRNSGVKDTHVVYIEAINKHWARGKEKVYWNHQVEYVPYCLNYASAIASDSAYKTKIMFEGES